MTQGLQTAVAGLRAIQQKIEVLANNVANLNTNGYNKSRVEFSDLPYAEPFESGGSVQIGQGIKASSVQKIFGHGPLIETGRSLDLALAGEGFFAVEQEDGQRFYTRDGSFQSQEREGWFYLTTSTGKIVLDQNGDPLTSPEPFEETVVSEDGTLQLSGLTLGTLGRFQFVNPEGLEAIGQKTYRQTAASGEAIDANTKLRQGYIEASNVDLSVEMTNLIRAQRVYSLLGRAINTADQMRQTAQEIRR